VATFPVAILLVSLGFAEDEVVVEGRNEASPSEGVSRTEVMLDARFSASDDVAQAVALTPGTTVRRLGGLGAWSGVSIRGSTFRHVVVAIDGLPLNPEGAGAIDLSTLPMGAFDRLVVYRGVVPLRFGVMPLGGVVDLRTAEKQAPQVRLSGGSWSTVRLQGSAGNAHTFFATEALHTAANFPYFSDNGTPFESADDTTQRRDNNRKRLWTAHGRGQGTVGGLKWVFQDTALWRDEGLAGPIGRPTETASLATGRNIAQFAIDGGGESGGAYARLSHIARLERYRDPAGELGTGRQDQTDLTSVVGLVVGAKRVWSGRALTEVSLRGRYERLSRQQGQSGFDPLFGRFVWTVQAESPLFLQTDRLSLRPGVLVTGVGDRISVGPQLSVQWEGESLTLFSNVGRGSRFPDLWELYGDRGNSVGNPDLRPESGWRADVGLSANTRPTSELAGQASLALFFKRNHDHILYVQNATSTLVPVNFGETRAFGLEAAARLSASDRVHIQGQGSVMWTENLDARPDFFHNQLPRIPLFSAAILAVLSPTDRVQLGASLSATAGNYWDATNWTLSAPRVIPRAWIRFRPVTFPVSVEASVVNVLNQTTALRPLDPLQPQLGSGPQALMDFSGYPLPGRTVMLQLAWTGE
jgi:vitamin B12 transporter